MTALSANDFMNVTFSRDVSGITGGYLCSIRAVPHENQYKLCPNCGLTIFTDTRQLTRNVTYKSVNQFTNETKCDNGSVDCNNQSTNRSPVKVTDFITSKIVGGTVAVQVTYQMLLLE